MVTGASFGPRENPPVPAHVVPGRSRLLEQDRDLALAPQALHVALPQIVHLLRPQVVPHLEPELLVVHLGQPGLVLIDERLHLAVRNIGRLAEHLGLEKILDRDIAPLGLLGEEPLADELVEALIEDLVALLLELGELRLDPLLHFLERDDLVAYPRRRRRTLGRVLSLRHGHSRPDAHDQDQETQSTS